MWSKEGLEKLEMEWRIKGIQFKCYQNMCEILSLCIKLGVLNSPIVKSVFLVSLDSWRWFFGLLSCDWYRLSSVICVVASLIYFAERHFNLLCYLLKLR